MNRHGKACGFTLLEILVVLVIIGVLIGFARLSVNTAGATKRLEESAQRLVLSAGLAAQQAVLTARPVGMVLHDTGFFLSEFNQGWQPLTGSARFDSGEFAPGIVLAGVDVDESADGQSPALIFLPDGENFLPGVELYDTNSHHSVMLMPAGNGYEIAVPQPRAN